MKPILALLLLWAVPAAAADRPWLGGQKNLTEAVRGFLKNGVSINDTPGTEKVSEIDLKLSGENVVVHAQYAGGMSYIDCDCSVPLKVSGNSLVVKCSMSCIEHFSQMRGPALDTRPQPKAELCFTPSRATHWMLEVRHAEASIEDLAPAAERWKPIHTGSLKHEGPRSDLPASPPGPAPSTR